jgi:hypothetical protein
MTELDRYGNPVERVRPERPPQPRPLNADEIQALIDLVVAYTRREPDRTMVEVWATQSLLGRWTYPEAAQAIHRWGYNRAPDAFLEPSDVTRTIRADRQEAAQRAEQARLEALPADPAAVERVREIVGGIAARMGWPVDEVEQASPVPVLAVPCPHCLASAGTSCTANGRPLQKTRCHPSRSEALAEQLKRGA